MSKSNSIVTLSADGKRLLDEVVFAYDSPKFYTFDVTGVNELVFTVPRGGLDISFGNVRLWKAGVPVSNQNTILAGVPKGTVDLMKTNQLYTYREGFVKPVLGDRYQGKMTQEKTISINRKDYDSGLQFSVSQALSGTEYGSAGFWLDKRYDKVSFIVGPRDNQFRHLSGSEIECLLCFSDAGCRLECHSEYQRITVRYTAIDPSRTVLGRVTDYRVFHPACNDIVPSDAVERAKAGRR